MQGVGHHIKPEGAVHVNGWMVDITYTLEGALIYEPNGEYIHTA